jgi:hypothetical protein
VLQPTGPIAPELNLGRELRASLFEAVNATLARFVMHPDARRPVLHFANRRCCDGFLVFDLVEKGLDAY